MVSSGGLIGTSWFRFVVSLELHGFIGWSHWNFMVSFCGLIGTSWFRWVVSLELGGFVGWSHWNLVVLSVALIGTWWFHRVVILEFGGFLETLLFHLNLVVSWDLGGWHGWGWGAGPENVVDPPGAQFRLPDAGLVHPGLPPPLRVCDDLVRVRPRGRVRITTIINILKVSVS